MPFEVKYQGEDIRDYSLPDSEVTYTTNYLEMKVAKDWGMRPSEYYALSVEDKATMIAFSGMSGLLDAVISDAANKKHEREMDNRRRTGR
jgi:hypothetical protein